MAFVAGGKLWSRRGQRVADSRSVVRMNGEDNLLIVGCGKLGQRVGKIWSERSDLVVGETRTNRSHAELRLSNIKPQLKGENKDAKFSNVLFSANAVGDVDEYLLDVHLALDRWDEQGTFLFTSSGAVYSQANGKPVTEDSQTYELGFSERTDRLLKAEKAVRERGGNVVRLSGLYKRRQHWDHQMWIDLAKESGGDFWVNILDYDDAATLVSLILSRAPKLDSSLFLGSDGRPVLLRSLAQYVGSVQGSLPLELPPKKEPSGKMYDNRRTRQWLGWEPQFDLVKDIHSFRSLTPVELMRLEAAVPALGQQGSKVSATE
ncbi:hypothetical protein NDN08_000142 [Rhodosorus marinus]|uniref:NAD-dependent epimerase/dehydratase domain-containing protein n=1 Tax=Rhodosorus marinus TaxID=101924 RepID=A0AAV8UEF0_9RHOD|nr:hypothetical protein NDN08_000142 [Rhodosorus marinus]